MATTSKTSDFCYKYLNFYLKFNTFVALPVFINRDFEIGSRLSIGLSYFYQFISELWMFLGLMSSVTALTMVWNDVNLFFGCFAGAVHMTQILSKIILLRWKKKKIYRQLKILNGIFDGNESLKLDDEVPSFIDFTSVILRKLRIFEYVMMVIITIWTSLFFVPFTYNSIINYDSLDNPQIPVVAYIPFNYTINPQYQLVIIFQAVLFYFNNLKTIAIDYFILGFIVIHVLQSRYLNFTLQRATKLLESKKQNENAVDDLVQPFLINWVKQHQDFILAIKESVNLLSQYFFIEFGYIIIHTCVPAFVITSTLSWTLNQKIVLIIMCTGSIINFYFLSLAGDLFTESIDQFGITFYGPHLFGKNKFYKLIHRMILFIGRHKSKVFGFSSVYPLCSVTFGAIMRLVMSCYLALNQIKGLKKEE